MQSQLIMLLGSFFGGLFSLIFGLAYFAFLGAIIYGGWKTFEKAGKPGWAMLVPIYNLVVLHEIVGREAIKLLLWFIPLVNIYFIITLYISLGKSFGKRETGELILSVFFWPLYLGLGSARYVGPVEGVGSAAFANPFGAANS
ncbi:hypothetical protein GCM10022409_03540 [Hymenobacter glaciei]|uniref:Signal peptidase I n=1 Tax=Hymenobacter glaciei TaxID=877209 RepID=A0ABP7T9E7_9BACT